MSESMAPPPLIRVNETTGIQRFIPVVVGPQDRTTANHSKGISSSSSRKKQKRPARSTFDLMQINITIYGISGILCTTSVEKKKRNLLLPTRTGKKATTDQSNKCNNNGDHQIPTTAVVSFKSNTVSSDVSMETFLPSLPLQVMAASPTCGQPMHVRHKADWIIDEAEEDPTKEKGGSRTTGTGAGPSTFSIIRAMKHEPACSDNTKETANNIHETFDLNICVVQGQELLSLGMASLSIAGDEKREIIMNLPAKPLGSTANTIQNKSLQWKKQSAEMTTVSFSNDATKSYTLDENASLRIGVRVLPVKTAEEHNKKGKKRASRLPRDDLLDYFTGLFRCGPRRDQVSSKDTFSLGSFPIAVSSLLRQTPKDKRKR
jgi:hypothetical protein